MPASGGTGPPGGAGTRGASAQAAPPGAAAGLWSPAMPELPEVETVCRGLRLRLAGRRLARVQQRRPDLRWPLPPRLGARLTGRRVERIDRRGKYMLVHLDDGMVLIAHLGMSGGVGGAAALLGTVCAAVTEKVP